MITREELYELVWSIPGWTFAPEFKVTDSYMSRVCRKLQVPRPSTGYWAMSEEKQALARRPLPPAGPGIPRFWSKSTRPPRPCPPRDQPRAAARKKDRGPTHPLIADAARHFQAAEPGADGDYLKPRKKLVVDVTASASGLAKCLAFADRLFRTLEGHGHRVAIAPTFELSRVALDPRRGTPPPAGARLWSPLRPTVVFLHTVPIGLAVAEIAETGDVQYAGFGNFVTKEEFERTKRFGPTWQDKRPLPCGRLKLTAYSPLNGFPWSREWSETAGTALDDGLEAIAAAIEGGALELLARLERRTIGP